MAPAVPGHTLEEFGHRAEIGESGEGKAGTDEGREEKPSRVRSQSQGRRGKHDEPGAEADLAFQRPARLDALYYREALLHPGGGAAFQNGEVEPARAEDVGGHLGELAHLTDEDDWAVAEIGEARLDLVHRNVDSAGDVAGGELAGGADIYKLEMFRRLDFQLRGGYCRGQSASY